MEPDPTAAEQISLVPSHRMRRILALCVGLLLLLIVVRSYNPRRELERVHVSGKASYRGQPIEVGQIRFSLIPPSTGPLTIEQIRDGEYETKLSGGLPVGHHRVEIKMYRPEEYATMGRSPGSPGPEQLLPDKYNRNSELTLNVAPGSKPFVHDFVLTD